MSSVNGAVRIATGQRPRRPKPTDLECEFVGECYAAWLGLAAHNGLHKLRCSTRTFENHFDHDLLICGPWEWDIDDSVRDGTVVLVRRDKTLIGDMLVSDLVIH